jgi:hypothetical protein
LKELRNELLRSAKRSSALRALEKTLDPPLSDDESIVEIIEDPARVLHEIHAVHERKELSLGEYRQKLDDHLHRLSPEEWKAKQKCDALILEASGGLLPDRNKKKQTKKRQTWTRDRLIKDLQALGIRSKRSKKRSG